MKQPHVQFAAGQALSQAPRGHVSGKWMGVGMFSLALALAAAFQVFAPAWVREPFASIRLTGITHFSALLLATAAVIVFHEAGHLTAALLVDFEVIGLALGPFRLRRFHGVRQIRFTAKGLFSGSVSAIPRHFAHWRGRTMAVASAGPLATLITGLATACAFLRYQPALQQHSFLLTFLGMLSEGSLLIFVLGLVPNSREGAKINDARLFLLCLWNEERANDILLYHRVMRLDADGIRPRDYPATLITELSTMRGRPDLMLLAANTIARYCADRSDSAGAKLWVSQALRLATACPGSLGNLTLARAAVLNIALDDDTEAAMGNLRRIEWENLSPAWVRNQARAVQNILSGSFREALTEISRSRNAMPSKLPVYDFEAALLNRLQNKALSLCTRHSWTTARAS